MGIKTLFWTVKDGTVYIASDLHLLKKVFDISNLNQNYFQEYYVSNGYIDTKSTPYQNVNRLPSACWLVASKEKVFYKRYWDISEYTNEIIYTKEEQYEEHFVEIMNEAVQSRLLPGQRNAVLMSGGLDSTTVFALAKQQEDSKRCEVIPISYVYEKYKNSDEREYIEPILAMYSTEGVYHNCDEEVIFNDFPNDTEWSYEPYVSAFSHAILNTMLHKASLMKAKNLFTGYAGDHVLNGTEMVIADQLKKGRIFFQQLGTPINFHTLQDFRCYKLFGHMELHQFLKQVLQTIDLSS